LGKANRDVVSLDQTAIAMGANQDFEILEVPGDTQAIVGRLSPGRERIGDFADEVQIKVIKPSSANSAWVFAQLDASMISQKPGEFATATRGMAVVGSR
jgi:hypothetical protein